MRSATFFLAIALCAAAYAMADDAAVKALKALVHSNAVFSTNFFKKIASKNKGENLISSPLSAHTILSMASYGAGGNTAKEMRQSLALPADDAVAQRGFKNLVDQFNNVKNVTLEIANKMYIAKDFKLKPKYKQLTAGSFRSKTSELDISKPEESVTAVNAWVNEKTHQKINSILEKDDIKSDTSMILLNAVYFKGKWLHQFEKSGTHDRTFHVDEKTEKKVPTMYVEGTFVYGELPELKAKFIELPYENKDLKMVIIVPDEINGLAQIEENLEAFNQTRLAKSGSEEEICLYLPKFKIESTIDLKDTLEKLGMKDMFSNAANFSSISDENLKVDKVVQKAYIEVNEEGSEAVAVTYELMTMEYSSTEFKEPRDVRIERPFVYRIINKRSGIILFAGLVVDPTRN